MAPLFIRVRLAACLLAVVAATALSACGGDATAESAGGAGPPHGTVARTTPSEPCPTKLNTFVDALERLRRQLAVGLSYEQYAARIKRLRASYAAIPIDHLTLGCLATAGTPAERALNKYIDAANAWGECLADTSCTTATIEPVLQRKWRVASRFLGEVQ